MGSVTPTLIPTEGYVRVEANWQDFPHARRAWLYRVAGGVATVLRDGDYAWLSNGIAVAFDHEAPLDVPVIYRSTAALNYNGDFEAGVAEWTDTTNGGTIGTVARSFDYYAPGTGNASLRLTPSGAAASKAVSEFIPATAGTVYTFAAQMMLAAAWGGGIRVQIQWFNGATPLSTSQGVDDFTPAPGVWAPYAVTAAAPATTTQCKVAVVVTGTPPATMPLYADEAYLTTAAGTVDSGPVVVPANGGGWWTDPLHPATKQRLQVDLVTLAANAPTPGVVYLGVGDESFPGDSAAMEVNDAVYPVATWQRRKSGRQEIRVGTATLADLAAIKALHASGAPLLLQLPAAFGEADAYQLHGDLATPRVHGDQTVPWRVAASQFVKVAPVVGPAEGTLKTRYQDFTKYASFEAAMAVVDRFARTVSGGWGNTTSGLPWSVSNPTESSVSPGTGVLVCPAINTTREAFLPPGVLSLADVDVTFEISVPAAPTGAGGQIDHAVRVRYTDFQNFVDLRAFRRVNTNDVVVAARQMLGGVESGLTAFPAIPGATAGSSVTLRLVAKAGSVQGWAWVTGQRQPVAPLVTTTATLLTAGGLDVYSATNASVTNVPYTTRWANLEILNLAGPTWLTGLRGGLVA